MSECFKMEIMYDGSAYPGWQKGNKSMEGMKTKEAIQDIIEGMLSAFFKETVSVCGAGRTDAGVHSMGQVASFLVTSSMQTVIKCMEGDICTGLRNCFNESLPEDIKIVTIREEEKGFHARFDAVSKVYCYRFDEREKENPFTRRYTYKSGKRLDLAAMEKAAAHLLGTHDFKAFCTNKNIDRKTTVRTVYWIKLVREKEEVKFFICGNGFLYNMVRIIAGTLLEAGLLKRDTGSVREALLSKNRQMAGPTLPPKGLCLIQVNYE